MGAPKYGTVAAVASLLVTMVVVGPSGAVDGPTVTAGNGIYSIVSSNAGAPAVGTFTAVTGATNPFGGGRSLLWGGTEGLPRSTYASVRRYFETSTQDWAQGDRGPEAIDLDSVDPTVELIGSTGVRTTYDTGSFELEEAVEVGGSVFEDAFMNVDLTLRNTSGEDLELGLRLLLDSAVDLDDGPSFQLADGPIVTTAETQVDPADDGVVEFRTRDNDTNTGELPTFSVVGRTVGTPTPELLQYACEPEAATFPFEYEIHAAVEVASPSDQCAPEDGGDSAVLLYWGATNDDAIVLSPGSSATVTLQLHVEQVRPIPTTLAPVPILLQFNPFQLTQFHVQATLNTAFGVPVVGREVIFTDPRGNVICAATTNAAGVAQCTRPMPWLTALVSLRYIAVFPGDTTYAPTQATAGLIG